MSTFFHTRDIFAIIGVMVGLSAIAHAQVTPSHADTARMQWGHNDFSRYNRPSMCDRAAMLTWGYETRRYNPDTVLQFQEGIERQFPEKAVDVARACLNNLDIDSVSPSQTWSLARVMLVVNEDAKSKSSIDRLLARGVTRGDTLHVLGKAIELYMAALPVRMDLALSYARQIDALSPGPGIQPIRFNVRNLIAGYWMRRYEVDSVKKYANEAIEIFRYMEPMERDMAAINSPFNSLINIANEKGDLAAQEAIMDTARKLMAEWRQDNGRRWLDQTARMIDLRSSMYGRKTQPLKGAFWLNNGGVPKPVEGKISLVVMANHNCGKNCTSQFIALKRLQEMYGDKLDLTIISVTQGYAPGSGVLTPEEEAKAAAEYFTKFHGLSAAILVDEAPVYTYEDGRVVRDHAPIVYTFNELSGVNAILTDTKGRVRWLGKLSNDYERKPLVLTINRILEEE